MIFSLGNLLTIFIVFTILIIFRALDRNNRSLEKVKRFSDKVRDSLAAVVEEKTAELKNLSIELGVNLKTGKEVLKRVREVEENLQAKAGGAEEIRACLDGYDKSLAELADMTGVDENLKRIQRVAVRDKVGKRLGEGFRPPGPPGGGGRGGAGQAGGDQPPASGPGVDMLAPRSPPR
jgi:hypothetical protein